MSAGAFDRGLPPVPELRARYGPRTKPIVFVSDASIMEDTNAGAARRAVLPLASHRSLKGLTS